MEIECTGDMMMFGGKVKMFFKDQKEIRGKHDSEGESDGKQDESMEEDTYHTKSYEHDHHSVDGMSYALSGDVDEKWIVNIEGMSERRCN